MEYVVTKALTFRSLSNLCASESTANVHPRSYTIDPIATVGQRLKLDVPNQEKMPKACSQDGKAITI